MFDGDDLRERRDNIRPVLRAVAAEPPDEQLFRALDLFEQGTPLVAVVRELRCDPSRVATFFRQWLELKELDKRRPIERATTNKPPASGEDTEDIVNVAKPAPPAQRPARKGDETIPGTKAWYDYAERHELARLIKDVREAVASGRTRPDQVDERAFIHISREELAELATSRAASKQQT